MWKLVLAVCLTILVSLTVYDFSPASSEDIKALSLKVEVSNSDKAKGELVKFLKGHPTPTNQELKDIAKSIDLSITEKVVADISGTTKTEAKQSLNGEIKPKIEMTKEKMVFLALGFLAIFGVAVMKYLNVREGN